ncbi:MAG: oligosaccharide flippase family protein [Candidatus Eisenbacteria bacterium]|nr:oligosaccharide flippase family protein [Candidatus Eisenbacteria bacterium]
MGDLATGPRPHRTAESLADKGAYNVLNTLLVVARSLILSILVARALGPSLQGLYSILLYVTQVGVQVVSLGFPSTLVRFVARRNSEGDKAGARAVVASIVRREIVLGLVATVTCALLAGALAVGVGQDAPRALFLLAALAILPDSLTLVYEAAFEGLLAYSLLLRINLALVPLSLAAAGAILLSGGGIGELLILKVALAVVRVALYWRVIGRRLPAGGTLMADTRSQMSRYTRSLTAIFLFDAVVWQRSEMLFLGLYCSRAAIAFYDIAYQVVGTTMRTLPEKLTDILFPVLSGLEQRGERERTAALYQRSVRLLFAVTLGISVTLGVCAGRLISLAYGPEYAPAADVIRVLCAAAPVVIVARATAYVLYAAGWQNFNVRLAGAAAALNILLAMVLIPRSGVVGAAVANSLTQVLSVCVLVSYVVRRSHARLPWDAMLRTLLAAAAQMTVMIWLDRVLGGWGALAGSAVCGVATYGAALMAMRVLTADERAMLARWIRRILGMRRTSAGGRN